MPLLQDLGGNYPLQQGHKALMNYCQNRNLMCIDFYETGFKSKGEKKLSVFYPDIHFNAKGHEIIAKSIYEKLKPLKYYKHLTKIHKGFNIFELIDDSQTIKKLDQKLLQLKDKNSPHKFKSHKALKQYIFLKDSNNLKISRKWLKNVKSKSSFIQTTVLNEMGSLIEISNKIIDQNIHNFETKKSQVYHSTLKHIIRTPLNENKKNLNPLLKDKDFSFDQCAFPLKFERSYLEFRNNYNGVKNIQTIFTALSFFSYWEHYFSSLVEYALKTKPLSHL